MRDRSRYEVRWESTIPMTLTCRPTSTQINRPTAPQPRPAATRSTTRTSAPPSPYESDPTQAPAPSQESKPRTTRKPSQPPAGRRTQSCPAGCGASTNEDGHPKGVQPVDRSADPPGSWRGDSKRIPGQGGKRTNWSRSAIAIGSTRGKGKDLTCVACCGESRYPDRHLIRFDQCLKGRDRINRKNPEGDPGVQRFSAEEAISRVPDAIRYTFQYDEVRYTQGVQGRHRTHGGSKVLSWIILRNYWVSDQYKGINSQWTEPAIRSALRTTVSYAYQLRGEATHARRLRAASHGAGR